LVNPGQPACGITVVSQSHHGLLQTLLVAVLLVTMMEGD